MATATVLLVDDDVDFLEVHQRTLEKAGFRVLTAHDSQEALQVLAEGKVDAAILDVMMNTPEEGFELARRLRANAATHKLPLIMLTSVNAVSQAQGHLLGLTDRDRDEMWLPVDRFLNKPVKAEQLVALLREQLHQS